MNKQSMIVVICLLMSAGCATPGKRTAAGAAVGAAGGAVAGAIIGKGKGAAIGAGTGAVIGGIVGNRMDKQAQELEKVAETKRTADGILVNLKNDLLFTTGSANLSDSAQTQLSELAGVFSKYPNDHITISGHTDNVGTNSLNATLSEQRANAVKTVLLQHGMAPAQVISQGFGESKPIESNQSVAGRAKNRRVELYVTDVESKKE